MTQINISTKKKKKQTPWYREKSCGCQGEGRGGKDWDLGFSRDNDVPHSSPTPQTWFFLICTLEYIQQTKF